MRNRLFIFIFIIAASLAAFSGCSTQRKARALRQAENKAELAFLKENFVPELDSSSRSTVRDTMKVTGLDGREVLIMKALKDDEGEMVAHDVLDAAKVTARFRNVAERAGKVSINFQVIVPQEMVDSRWQLRLYPDMVVMEDTVGLDPIFITGQDYRRAQLKGYERYDRFVSSIITDTSVFVNAFLLDKFLKRNFKEVYAFKNDTRFVTDREWESAFGVTGPEAVRHYTYSMRVKMNERKKARMDRMFKKYVKSPIISEGLRLDTIVRAADGSFIYDYIQQINTRPKLRKVDIYLSGNIFEQEDLVYRVPTVGPLTFYISSLSSLVDSRERYMTRIVERKVSADTRCRIDFATGRSDIDLAMGDNARETERIRGYLRALMTDDVFDLDSVQVTSYASPEGRLSYNASLSLRRAESVGRYFRSVMSEMADSIRNARGFSVDEAGNVVTGDVKAVDFTGRSHGEDWETLDALVMADTVMTDGQKEKYRSMSDIEPDRREYLMQSEPWYAGMKERLYPALRTVRFDFHMHRKGMVKDTVHTTVLDSAYMDGVQAIRDMDYERALVLLRKYDDYNAAVAHLGLGHDESAFAILSRLERTAQVNYMLAIIHSRRGEDREAVECYLRSCEQEPTYVHRGNLDPEISVLIGRYSLNAEPEDEFEYSF